MPVLDGLELAKIIRENRINSDIIVVTAANDIEHLDEMLRYGVIDYLIKPFDRNRFNKAINKFLKKANLFQGKMSYGKKKSIQFSMLKINMTMNLKKESKHQP